MLLFAHTGITLGSALLLGNALSKGYSQRSLPQCIVATSASSSLQPDSVDNTLPWFNSLARKIDYRLILVGALLPDIVDKPVGTLLFRDFFSNGRIFCHTLLFLVTLGIAAVWLYRRQGTTWLLALSFGTFIHLILDQMWLMPHTLLWPIYGWAFERIDVSHWLQDILYALRTDPAVYIPEIVGFAILTSFAAALVHRKRVYAFVKKGTI